MIAKTLNKEDAVVNLVELKKLAVDLLPSDSSLKAIILSEPDYMPEHDAMIMIDIFAKLLWKEVKG